MVYPHVHYWCIIGVSERTPLREQWNAFSHSYLLPSSPLTLSCTGEYAQSKIEILKINALRSSEPFDDWFVVNSLWQWCYGGANEVVKVTMGIL